MSVVGPRPHALAHNEQYRKLVPGYMLRHKVKPGRLGAGERLARGPPRGLPLGVGGPPPGRSDFEPALIAARAPLLRRLADDAPLREHLGKAARAYAQAHLGREPVLTRFLERLRLEVGK